MLHDAKEKCDIGERFRAALREEIDRLAPHDPPRPTAAVVVARVVVVTTQAVEPNAAPRYAVHVARVAVVDGEEEVVGGVATPCLTNDRLEVAERSADVLAADPETLRRMYGADMTHVVVNDGRGNERYRRAIQAG